MPPAKLESDPWRDKPTASPIAPRIATKEDVSIPSFEMKETNKMIRKTQSKISARNFVSVGSRFLFTIILLMNLLMRRMI